MGIFPKQAPPPIWGHVNKIDKIVVVMDNLANPQPVCSKCSASKQFICKSTKSHFLFPSFWPPGWRSWAVGPRTHKFSLTHSPSLRTPHPHDSWSRRRANRFVHFNTRLQSERNLSWWKKLKIFAISLAIEWGCEWVTGHIRPPAAADKGDSKSQHFNSLGKTNSANILNVR